MNFSGNAGDKYYLLKGNDDTDYNVFATAECDENGCITYKTNSLDTIIITPTDIVSLRQAEEEALKREQAEKEAAEKAEQEAVLRASEDSIQSTESKEALQPSDPTEKTTQNRSLYWVIGGIAILGVALMLVGLVTYRKNR